MSLLFEPVSRLIFVLFDYVPSTIFQLNRDSSIRIFCKDLFETLKYVDEFSELKKRQNSKRTHTHLSLSLYLSIRQCTLIFAKDVHAPVSPSLSLSLYLHLQKRFWSRSDPNGIQERLFRQFKKLSIHYAKCRTMRTIRWGFSISQVYTLAGPMRGSRGGTWESPPPPSEKLQKYRFS